MKKRKICDWVIYEPSCEIILECCDGRVIRIINKTIANKETKSKKA